MTMLAWMQVGLITMQTTNHQNGEHVPRRHKLIRFAHEACRELGIVYWRPRQRGAVLEKGPEFDLTKEEPTYQLGDHDKAEAEALRSNLPSCGDAFQTPAQSLSGSMRPGRSILRPRGKGVDPLAEPGLTDDEAMEQLSAPKAFMDDTHGLPPNGWPGLGRGDVFRNDGSRDVVMSETSI